MTRATLDATDLQPKEIIHPYVDASGQVAFEVVRLVYDKHTGFVQHRRPSEEGDGSWILSLDAGEFMRSASGEDWKHFDAGRWDQYPSTRERKVLNAAPNIPYRLRE